MAVVMSLPLVAELERTDAVVAADMAELYYLAVMVLLVVAVVVQHDNGPHIEHRDAPS